MCGRQGCLPVAFTSAPFGLTGDGKTSVQHISPPATCLLNLTRSVAPIGHGLALRRFWRPDMVGPGRHKMALPKDARYGPTMKNGWLDRRGPVERRFDAWVRTSGIGIDPPPTDVERAVALDYARTQIHRFARGACILSLLGLSLAWAFDGLALAAEPAIQDAYSRMRGVLIVIIVFFLALHRPLARFAFVADSVLVLLVLFSVSWSLSPLGLDQPHLHTTYWLLFATVIGLVGLRKRVVSCALAALAFWAGIFLTRPELIEHPDHGLVLASIGGVSVIAWVLGHYLFSMLLNLFVARQRLANTADLLKGQVEQVVDELQALTYNADALREEERRWMAHEVHDELGQQLTALRFAVAAGASAVTSDMTSAPAILEDLESRLTLTSSIMRRLIRRLRPVALEEFGLEGALKWLVDDVGRHEGLSTEVQIDEACDTLEPDIALMLFRATQEALTNIVKHADASHVRVGLSPATDGTWTLRITDDGVGLSLPPGRRGGLGMAGVRMRAHACGASVQWKAGPRGGTEMILKLGH